MKQQENKPENIPAIIPPVKPAEEGKNDCRIVLSLKLLNYIFKKENVSIEQSRMTRAQAFHDILSRQHLAAITDDPSWIIRGTHGMSDDWKWNRDTVVRFLDNLVRENAAVVFSMTGKTTVVLKNIMGMPDLPKEILDSLPESARADFLLCEPENHPNLPSQGLRPEKAP